MADTMGYAFVYPLVRSFSSKTRIGAYVHYPTISTDMIQRVETRAASHTNSASVAASSWRSRAKLLYYRLFAFAYSFALRRADVLVANGSWTAAHLDTLTSRPKGSTAVVYPPCDTGSLSSLPLEGRQPGAVVSLAQFRPEKEHATQLRLLRLALDKKPDLPLHLVLMGSSRDASDEERIASLRALATELRLDEHVEFVVNAPYSEVIERLSRASIGLSTMRDEHFGINVVEFMAAGLVTLSHASAGPLLDIAVKTDAGPTGFHADEPAAFAAELIRIVSTPPDEVLAIRKRARARAVATFGTKAFTDRWEDELWARLDSDATRGGKKRQ
jgi:alpha-1,2-mannosyltransferase